MTKSQLIERVAARAPHIPRREVEAIVQAMFDTMTAALQAEQRIEVRGFGVFSVKVREAHAGRNPKTGAQVFVPRRRTPCFTMGKELKERLNPVATVILHPRPSSPPPTQGHGKEGVAA